MSVEAASAPITAVDSEGRRDYSPIALIIGVIGIGIAAVGLAKGLIGGHSRPLVGWLLGFSIWLSVAIGMLFLLMLFYLFNAGWSGIVRRQLEHALSVFKWLGLIFLPLLAIVWVYHRDPGILWSWLNPDKVLPGGETVGQDVLYEKKHGYLNKGFFTVRVVLFFGIWIGLSEILRRASFRMDEEGDPKWYGVARKTSAVGIILCAMATTFAAIDWFKSLEYHWFSTMYGVWFFAESMRAGIAVTVLLCLLLQWKGYLRGIYNDAHSYTLGCLMLAFTVFWAYISFCQYFLVYNANIPEETFWYVMREVDADGSKNSWWWISMGLVFGHFLIPFLLLLWYKNKSGLRIVLVASWIFVFHISDIYWNILPGKIPGENILGFVVRQFTVAIWDVSMFVGVGGIFAWSFLKSARKAKPIPIRDPHILESLHHHE